MRSLVVVQLDSRTPKATTRADLVAEGMEALTSLLEQEESPGVRALAGHWLFGYVSRIPTATAASRAS